MNIYRHELVIELLAQRLIAVVREPSSARALATTKELAAAGVHAIEIALTTPGAIDALSAMRDASLLLGAGTVTDPYAARAVILAGARFLVSPSADHQVAEVARSCGVPYVAGARTPTEVERAVGMGADVVKLFPAGDPVDMRHLRAVYPHVALVPTGGVGLVDAPDYLEAGAVAVGIGKALTPEGVPDLLARLAAVRR